MRHFSCDLCGKSLVCGEVTRYVVRVDGFAANDPVSLTDTDLDADSIDLMAELMERIESGECDDPMADDAPPANARREYDLCPNCYVKLLADPLGLESRRKLQFSDN
jgi:hypothetical protein